ncbi:GntR family transcriptional regulator [Streptomyces sp. 7N604]
MADDSSGRDVVRRIADDLSAQIARNVYPVGSWLPPAEELAFRYDVPQGIVRVALNELRKRGLTQGYPRGILVLAQSAVVGASPIPVPGWEVEPPPSRAGGVQALDASPSKPLACGTVPPPALPQTAPAVAKVTWADVWERIMEVLDKMEDLVRRLEALVASLEAERVAAS